MVASVLKGIGLLFVLLVVAAMFLPPLEQSRGQARRTQCKINLQRIMQALNAYESRFGEFPPSYTVSAEGQPLHSWRTLILPYLEGSYEVDHQLLYDKIDIAKPWNAPANESAYKTAIFTYGCPSADFPHTQAIRTGSMTTYLAVITDDSSLRPIESRKKNEISDGLSTTLMVFEVAPEQAVHWMEPADTDLESILKFGSSKQRPHVGGTHIALADGTVRFISTNVRESTLRALVSTSGNEVVGGF